MNKENIIIGPATIEDVTTIAQVVAMALGGDPATHPLYAVFLELAGYESSPYSYRNSLIAEIDSNPVGAIVGYDGAMLHELRKPIFPLIQKHLGKTIEIEEETQAGEFYLDSVAVFPSYQGLGIGRMLIEAMRDKAFSEGHERFGLIVDVDNPRAEALYQSIGFKRINPTTFLGHKMWHLQIIKK
jgi:ribosomal protein S18 acetylase RimI-like enzyme